MRIKDLKKEINEKNKYDEHKQTSTESGARRICRPITAAAVARQIARSNTAAAGARRICRTISDGELKLKRKRTTERAKATRFITSINEFTGDTPLDDYEHYRGRLHETLDQLVQMDDSIQHLLQISEYSADADVCEYIYYAKRAILKANQEIGRRLASSAANLSISELPPPLRQLDHRSLTR